MKEILFITGNAGKVAEVQQLTADMQTLLFKQHDIGYPEIQADTLEEVARFGVNHVQQQINQPFILEDAGMFINALQGFPGVYSKYVYYTIGLEGILTLMREIPEKHRTATFRSVYAYGESSGKTEIFLGECSGIITQNRRGSQGFGYDPIFIPTGSNKTFAQMDTKEKNLFSHRGKAVQQLKYFLKEKIERKQ